MALIHSKTCNKRRGPQYPCDCKPHDNTPKVSELTSLRSAAEDMERALENALASLEHDGPSAAAASLRIHGVAALTRYRALKG